MINTTSDTISEFRKATLKRLAEDRGFAAALEADAAAQSVAEDEWITSRESFRGVKRFVSNVCATPSTTAKARSTYPTINKDSPDTAVAKAIQQATSISIAQMGESIAAENAFERDAMRVRMFPLSSMTSGLYEVKTPAGDSEASVADLRHEAFVCMFGTNKLRPYIHNFPYVYAFLKSPFVQNIQQQTAAAARAASPRRQRGVRAKPMSSISGKEVVDQLPAIVKELVIGKTLKSEIESGISEGDFVKIILQTSYALKFALEEIGFTHYDLQSNTVVLREMDTPAYIPYEGGKVYVSARWIVTFTDFGFSHITPENSTGKKVSFGFAARGRGELVELGIFRDRKNPMTDIYRLMLTCAAGSPPNSPVRNVVEKLVKYFNQTESLEDILEKQRDNYYYLPLDSKSRAYSFEEFITHTKREARNAKWVPDATSLIVTPTHSTVPPKRQIVQMKMFGPWPGIIKTVTSTSHHVVPSSFVEFADMYRTIVGKIESEEDVEIAKSVTAAFIKGFSEDSSLFNAALDAARAELDDIDREISGILEASPRFERVGMLPSTVTGKARSSASAKKLNACCVASPNTIIASTYIALLYRNAIDIIRSAQYVSETYWSPPEKEPPICVVESISEMAEKVKSFAPFVSIMCVAMSNDLARASEASGAFETGIFGDKVSSEAFERRIGGATQALNEAIAPCTDD